LVPVGEIAEKTRKGEGATSYSCGAKRETSRKIKDVETEEKREGCLLKTKGAKGNFRVQYDVKKRGKVQRSSRTEMSGEGEESPDAGRQKKLPKRGERDAMDRRKEEISRAGSFLELLCTLKNFRRTHKRRGKNGRQFKAKGKKRSCLVVKRDRTKRLESLSKGGGESCPAG